jgi:hypothetical protein
LANAATPPGPARLAALESLTKLALPATLAPLLDIAAKSGSDSDCAPVLEALHAVCQASPDHDQTTRAVLDSLARLPAEGRGRVLVLLAELGTAPALEAARAALHDPDAELAKEAVRVLAQWPNAAPATDLLDLARTSAKPAIQTLALRGCIAVLGHEPDLHQRLTLLRQAAAAAQRPDEKKQALAQLGQIPTAEALEAVLADLGDAALASEAAQAALNIAEKLAPTQPKLAADAGARVLALCKTPDTFKRAWALRGRPPAAGPFLQNWVVCGPYRQNGVVGALALFNLPFGPEKPGEPVQWQRVPPGDGIALSALFPGQENCVAYLKTTVVAPQAGEAILLVGSDDGVKAWLNGAVVHSNNVDRGDVPDQDMAPIQLKEGPNELLLKITQGGGGWSAHARIVGPDGQPIPGLHSP